MINIILPRNGRLRASIASNITKVKLSRKRTFLKNQYNTQRQQYYALTTTKKVEGTLKVSIVVPCFNTPQKYFEPLLASIFNQSYENWELILTDASTDDKMANYLKERATSDTRIKYSRNTTKGIAANTNEGLKELTGDLVAFMDHDDTLDDDALALSVEQFNLYPETGLAYSDEDKLSENGETYLDPHFKPDFSLDMLRNVNYITHFVVVRTEIVKKLDGIRPGFDGAQDYDFLLRVVDTGCEVRHVPKVLYHWRLAENSTAADFSNKSHITNAGEKALNDHFTRNRLKTMSSRAIKNKPGFYLTHFEHNADVKKAVTIILPAETPVIVKDTIKDKYLQNESIAKHQINVECYENIDEIEKSKYDTVIIINGLTVPKDKKVQVDQLFGLVEDPGVFAASPILTANGLIKDMGLVNTESGTQPLFKGMNPNNQCAFGALEWARNVNGLTGKVMAIKTKNIKSLSDGSVVDATGRLVIWPHVEMTDLDILSEDVVSKEQNNYYNTNLEVDYSPIVKKRNDINQIVKVKK